jgi:hypothetical protein
MAKHIQTPRGVISHSDVFGICRMKRIQQKHWSRELEKRKFQGFPEANIYTSIFAEKTYFGKLLQRISSAQWNLEKAILFLERASILEPLKFLGSFLVTSYVECGDLGNHQESETLLGFVLQYMCIVLGCICSSL